MTMPTVSRASRAAHTLLWSTVTKSKGWPFDAKWEKKMETEDNQAIRDRMKAAVAVVFRALPQPFCPGAGRGYPRRVADALLGEGPSATVPLDTHSSEFSDTLLVFRKNRVDVISLPDEEVPLARLTLTGDDFLCDRFWDEVRKNACRANWVRTPLADNETGESDEVF
jgi:hypothetical protein